MLNMIDGSDAIDCLLPKFAATSTEPQNDLDEAITSLWSAHVTAKHAARASKDELRSIRAKLGEQLSEMKEILARPGCGGLWSSFLKERQIPRATADRLVASHLRFLSPDVNRPSEAISEPTDDDVRKLFDSLWPKLRHTLRTPQSLYRMVDLLTSQYECSELTDRGILVLKPAVSTTVLPVPESERMD